MQRLGFKYDWINWSHYLRIRTPGVSRLVQHSARFVKHTKTFRSPFFMPACCSISLGRQTIEKVLQCCTNHLIFSTTLLQMQKKKNLHCLVSGTQFPLKLTFHNAPLHQNGEWWCLPHVTVFRPNKWLLDPNRSHAPPPYLQAQGIVAHCGGGWNSKRALVKYCGLGEEAFYKRHCQFALHRRWQCLFNLWGEQ